MGLLAGGPRENGCECKQRRQHQRLRANEDKDAENNPCGKESFLPPKHQGKNGEQGEQAAFETVGAGGPEIDIEHAGERDRKRERRGNAADAHGGTVSDVESECSADNADDECEYFRPKAKRNGHGEQQSPEEVGEAFHALAHVENEAVTGDEIGRIARGDEAIVNHGGAHQAGQHDSHSRNCDEGEAFSAAGS